jgi:8-oxo-dGTP diphosphatase
MERLPTFVLVAAAAIADPADRLLLQQCPPHKPNAGMWEFPGGKVETGENPRLALRREIAEELGIELEPKAMRPAGFAEEARANGELDLVMLLYTCTSWSGEPEAREGQRWRWFARAEAASLDLPPMDWALLDSLPVAARG